MSDKRISSYTTHTSSESVFYSLGCNVIRDTFRLFVYFKEMLFLEFFLSMHAACTVFLLFAVFAEFVTEAAVVFKRIFFFTSCFEIHHKCLFLFIFKRRKS